MTHPSKGAVALLPICSRDLAASPHYQRYSDPERVRLSCSSCAITRPWLISVSLDDAGLSMYFLASQRLCFREWSVDDAPLAILVWCDPTVTQFIGGLLSPEQARQRLQREIEVCATSGVQYWPVFLTSTDSFVGAVAFAPTGLTSTSLSSVSTCYLHTGAKALRPRPRM
jgi:hypothetical protein